MSHPMAKRRKTSYIQNIEVEENENGNCNAFVIPQDDDSDDSDHCSESENFDDQPKNIRVLSYSQILNNYEENQSKLEPEYKYSWNNGEKTHNLNLTKENLLPDKTKNFICKSSYAEIFELFFSLEIKNYIIESTRANSYELTLGDFDIFVGIIITSIFNGRKSQKDYWSRNELLGCPAIANAMSRNKFLEIKSKIKFSKSEDKSSDDRAWRQFIQNKPERFGIKMWGICNPSGYLFDCDIYCGKGSNIYSTDNKVKLAKCALGSRVVLMMVKKLLTSISPRKLTQYHLYFDNFFTSPDLMVHLNSLGLKATGTVRKNRVNVDNELDKKAPRGSISVKHELKSGLNFITVMDSKPVSLLSTAAGVEPLLNVKRYSKSLQSRENILFPRAITLYNEFMGGVDMHDGHCSNLMPSIRAKKWTWPMFLRLIQSSLTNALVIYNLSNNGTNIGSKEIVLAVAKHYLSKKKEKWGTDGIA
ncbi:piggyBac transposable element-derived protein 3-like [Prorops nasuta]|uniref:piggyBac transposable element-derived protein 3-like n=1 Tax=Prorops nasuta TaxID=863751 RepID=UPI0034CD065E